MRWGRIVSTRTATPRRTSGADAPLAPRVKRARGLKALLFATPLAVMMVAMTLSGCETRDHSNPLDPSNPETGGEPRVLNAIAADSSVTVRWDIEGLNDPTGLRLTRRAGSSDEELLFEGDYTSSGEFIDAPIPNGQRYEYVLELRDPNGEWLPTAPDAATPGRAKVWLGDAAGGGLRRISPDGRDTISRHLNGDFLDFEVTSGDIVWAPNWTQGYIVSLDSDGEVREQFEHIGGNTIAVDRRSGEIWIGSFNARSLTRYGQDGSLLWQFSDAGPVEDVFAARGTDGGIWAAIRLVGVQRVFGNAIRNRWDQFGWPVSVLEDEFGFVWVVDRADASVSRIQISTGDVFASAASFGDPVDGSLDARGGCYVADPVRGGVVHVDSAGREANFFALGAVSAVTYDPDGERLWVVTRDDGRVRSLRLDGTEISSIEVGGRPVKVEGNWSP